MFDANLRYGVRDKQAVFVKPYNLNSGLREIGLTTKEVYLAIKITKHSIVYEGNADFTGFIDENSLEMAKEVFGE